MPEDLTIYAEPEIEAPVELPPVPGLPAEGASSGRRCRPDG